MDGWEVKDRWLSEKELVCLNPACRSRKRREITLYKNGIAEFKCDVCKCINRVYPNGAREFIPTPETPRNMYCYGMVFP